MKQTSVAGYGRYSQVTIVKNESEDPASKDRFYTLVGPDSRPIGRSFQSLTNARKAAARIVKDEPTSDVLPAADDNVIRVTSAPSAYDGHGTATVELLPFTDRSGNQWRSISVRSDSLTWQEGRNTSGLYATLTVPTFQEWVKAGLVRAVQSQEDSIVTTATVKSARKSGAAQNAKHAAEIDSAQPAVVAEHAFTTLLPKGWQCATCKLDQSTGNHTAPVKAPRKARAAKVETPAVEPVKAARKSRKPAAEATVEIAPAVVSEPEKPAKVRKSRKPAVVAEVPAVVTPEPKRTEGRRLPNEAARWTDPATGQVELISAKVALTRLGALGCAAAEAHSHAVHNLIARLGRVLDKANGAYPMVQVVR